MSQVTTIDGVEEILETLNIIQKNKTEMLFLKVREAFEVLERTVKKDKVKTQHV